MSTSWDIRLATKYILIEPILIISRQQKWWNSKFSQIPRSTSQRVEKLWTMIMLMLSFLITCMLSFYLWERIKQIFYLINLSKNPMWNLVSVVSTNISDYIRLKYLAEILRTPPPHILPVAEGCNNPHRPLNILPYRAKLTVSPCIPEVTRL